MPFPVKLSLLDEPLVDGDVEELVVALQPRGEHRLRVLRGLRGRQLVGVGRRRRAGRLGDEGGVVEGVRGGARVQEAAQHVQDVLVGGHPGDERLEKMRCFS